MSNAEDVNRGVYTEKPMSRRQIRAARMRAKALSPLRIIMLLLSFPLLTTAVATSIYIRTSPYDPTAAVAHLIALGGCDAASYFGLAPAYYGELGYHARNDANDNGVACEFDSQLTAATSVTSSNLAAPEPAQDTGNQQRMVNGAKFVKP